MKLKLFGLVLMAAVAVASASAATRPPIFSQALATGNMKATVVHATTGSVVLDRITVAPGGNFGWHTHGAPVAVVVMSGTLTVFDPSVGGCAPFKVSKGQSFVEPANHVHLARNDGKAAVRLYALYMGVPKGAEVNNAAQEPATCNA